MSLFGKLFEKNTESPQPGKVKEPTPLARSMEDLRNDPNYIRVFDSFGRELFITKEQWRTDSLPAALKSNWDSPDRLYDMIVMALHDGFFTDILQAAEHLHQTDTIASRGATIYGIVLMKMNRLDEAEEVFHSYLQAHGDDGTVLTNLAKVYSSRNETQKAEDTLWHALEVDPNMENALAWHRAIHRERDGEAADIRELERVSALPGSWRAQLWLARAALQSHDLAKALSLYRSGLQHVARPVPTDFLMQVSGDLGNLGYLSEAIQLVETEFLPNIHGLQVGNNLIKAHLDLGQIEAAAKILEQLYGLQRPDWKETLSFWDTAIAKARLEKRKGAVQQPLEAAILTIDGPVWLKPASLGSRLFLPQNLPEISVSFLGSSATIPGSSDHVQLQLADHPGRLSRAVPLFLAEQTHFHLGVSVQTLIPWIKAQPGGFMLSGVQYSDADTANYAKIAQERNQYVVITHLTTRAQDSLEPWKLELRLVRTSDAKCIDKLDASFSPAKPEECLLDLAARLTAMLAREIGTICKQAPAWYQVPIGRLPDYLLRLEQLLATRCAAMETPGRGSLNGEREIIDGMLGLCLAFPSNVVVRLVLAQTLLTMKVIRPEVVASFKDNVQQLQRQSSLPEPANAVISELFDDASHLS
jgi:tetratricopeptide (TPR) repeat protein